MNNKNINIVLSHNDWGLLSILHEGIIERLDQCILNIEEEELDKLQINSQLARDILTELIVLFNNPDANRELGSRLISIYVFINKLITDGVNQREVLRFQEAKKVIRPILEGFQAREKEEEARVVSGLTYGRDDLNKYTKSDHQFKA